MRVLVILCVVVQFCFAMQKSSIEALAEYPIVKLLSLFTTDPNFTKDVYKAAANFGSLPEMLEAFRSTECIFTHAYLLRKDILEGKVVEVAGKILQKCMEGCNDTKTFNDINERLADSTKFLNSFLGRTNEFAFSDKEKALLSFCLVDLTFLNEFNPSKFERYFDALKRITRENSKHGFERIIQLFYFTLRDLHDNSITSEQLALVNAENLLALNNANYQNEEKWNKVGTFDEIVKKHFADLSDKAFDAKLAEWSSPEFDPTKIEKNGAALNFSISVFAAIACFFLLL